MPNLMMPGNPRYQPKELVPFFGYDNTAKFLVEVELAVMWTLTEMGVIPQKDMALLRSDHEELLYAITTSEMDEVERAVTKHDIRALVRLMQERMPAPLRRWVHVPLTSYDVLDTARILQYARAHEKAVRPKVNALIRAFRDIAARNAGMLQIGRTHGQYALPITVGFWLATILERILFNAARMNECALRLRGKISGAVGAYNAQIALGFTSKKDTRFGFEDKVLAKLGLKAAPISTQILPPEPLAYYLHACTMLSAALGQFGSDARHLMRSEIREISEPFAAGQVGSSTMAHKRNPVNFENTEGMWQNAKKEFLGSLDTLISEHQRDLVGSSAARNFPAILCYLMHQMNTLLREDAEGVPFLKRLYIDENRCMRNLRLPDDKIMAEPLYLMLQLHGYEGDAHELVNERAMPLVLSEKRATLLSAIEELALDDWQLRETLAKIPEELLGIVKNSRRYNGLAFEKAWEICVAADRYLETQ